MADGPDWLSDKPVDVNVDSLAAFAMLMQAELDQNVKPGATSVPTWFWPIMWPVSWTLVSW